MDKYRGRGTGALSTRDFIDNSTSLDFGPLRLDVLSVDIADAVESAGGWLFDRARSGWAVTVFLDNRDADPRPLEILGVKLSTFECLPDLAVDDRRPHAVAASCDLMQRDKSVRAEIFKALKRPARRVILWGNPLPDMGYRFNAYRHTSSPAAEAFKAHSLRAIGRDGPSSPPIEDFRGRIKPRSPCDSDLVIRRPSSTAGLGLSHDGPRQLGASGPWSTATEH